MARYSLNFVNFPSMMIMNDIGMTCCDTQQKLSLSDKVNQRYSVNEAVFLIFQRMFRNLFYTMHHKILKQTYQGKSSIKILCDFAKVTAES